MADKWQKKGKYDTSRSFLLLTYKLYHKLDTLSGTSKAYCLTVIMSLLKYAWKSSDYKCAIRYSTITKDTKLSKMTIRRSCRLLADLNIITIKRLASANLYSINTSYLKAEVLRENTQKYTREHSGVSSQNSINRNINNNNTLIEKIIRKGLAKEELIKELSTLPLSELENDITNKWYCKLAMEKKRELESEKKLVPVEKIISSLKNTGKKTNSAYRYTVAKNKKYHIKPWENKKWEN